MVVRWVTLLVVLALLTTPSLGLGAATLDHRPSFETGDVTVTQDEFAEVVIDMGASNRVDVAITRGDEYRFTFTAVDQDADGTVRLFIDTGAMAHSSKQAVFLPRADYAENVQFSNEYDTVGVPPGSFEIALSLEGSDLGTTTLTVDPASADPDPRYEPRTIRYLPGVVFPLEADVETGGVAAFTLRGLTDAYELRFRAYDRNEDGRIVANLDPSKITQEPVTNGDAIDVGTDSLTQADLVRPGPSELPVGVYEFTVTARGTTRYGYLQVLERDVPRLPEDANTTPEATSTPTMTTTTTIVYTTTTASSTPVETTTVTDTPTTTSSGAGDTTTTSTTTAASATNGDGPTTTAGPTRTTVTGPGFGVLAAALALLGMGVLRTRRR